jgi:fructose-specific phosphotransferase system IIA component
MTIRLSRYIRPECCILDLEEGSREAALHRIVHAAMEKGLVADENHVFEKLMERENLQSTAVGNGIAIPHCFVDEIPGLIIIVACSHKGLEFDSFDGKPTRLIFLLLGNRQEYSLHIKALARIAQLMKNIAFMEKLGSSTSAQQMIGAFAEEEAKIG